jgi:4'-phosphopantetheinyl transferase
LEFPPAPTHLDSPTAEVHVWRADAGGAPSDAVLQRVLALYLGEAPGEIGLVRGEHGKPRLAEEPERLAFNLSHSDELVLVAVSRGREVGVDVEREKPARDLVALAERALDPGEATAVHAAAGDERTRLFYELWTWHEARLKCLGIGLAATPAGASPPVAVATVPIDPEYAAAVAVTGNAVPVRCWTLD